MTMEIRHVEPGDAAAIHAMLVSPHVVDGTMRLPFASLATTEKRIAPRLGHHRLAAVEAGDVTGFAELVCCPDVPRHAHVGEINLIITRADRQRRGIGRALMGAMIELADDWLGLVRLELVVWTRNERAVRLYESCGFRIEGTLGAYVLWRGTFVDAHAMGRVRAQRGSDAAHVARYGT